jgi:hypothetical protein
MVTIMIGQFGLTDPDRESSFKPSPTNKQFFQLMAIHTHTFNTYPALQIIVIVKN